MRERAAVRNAADREQVKWAGRSEKRLAEWRNDCTRAVLSTPEGRWFIADLLEQAHIHVTSYAESPHATYFREGERNFGLRIQAQSLAADADAYDVMTQEMRAFKDRDAQTAQAIQERDKTDEVMQ